MAKADKSIRPLAKSAAQHRPSHTRRGRPLPLPDAVLHPKSGPTNRPGLPSLGWAFLRTGAFAFGGLGATLALLQRDLVDRRGWLRASDVSEALALHQPLPGSTVVQAVTFLGWRMGGWPGANRRDNRVSCCRRLS